jgi:hypothetical protein
MLHHPVHANTGQRLNGFQRPLKRIGNLDYFVSSSSIKPLCVAGW